ncbi:class I SAM-dependent methyltransferase [Candidatus Dojkabacteria bacterium]|uniref:Class I SAM-dependent methyltransferase n=1 Tax=Candidatus Dojkabacteria bacterium TaxID=2099670 RepID=A0A955RI80_9BACT|nr:class I SAM-dependent methyltransferase [Candidatus Dojkabacteria bacterium]
MTSSNWQENAGDDFEQIKEGSPTMYWSFGLQRRLDLMLQRVDFKNKKILDVGCGIGTFVKKFGEYSSQVYGLEYDQKKVDQAIPEVKQNIVQGEAEKLPYPDEAFDIVFSHEVLEHVNDDQKAVEEAFRVLKNNGEFIVFCPNRMYPFETHGIFIKGKYHFGNIPFVPYLPKSVYKKLTPHVRNYTNKDLLSLFNDRKWQITYHSHVFPGFDGLQRRSKFFSKLLRGLYSLETTPLGNFGISHYLIAKKAS